ncbi:MAG: YIP1 family protein [Candidatus Binatus sp.]|uniref:YIP1 family protein n=1 Tax=Candidatus Binatus sp. TaxID=2811406 RepID=UPI002723BDB5|nr:YIP1 family protein [Candidatus Binatus sp.]MDO8430958.1 YIP1 family protein [Candidatus Binatus sp.]
MANGATDSIAPFFTIWTEPRATIRRIVDTDPTRHTLALAALAPALATLESQWSKAIGNSGNISALWPIGVVFAVAAAAVFGIGVLYLNGVVLRWSSGLLGGTATRTEVRAAITWSQVPSIVAGAITIAALLTGAIVPPTAGAGGSLKASPQLIELGLLNGILAIWGFVISLKCLGEVNRFSAWRALGAVLIPLVILVVVIVVIARLVAR